jgi:hypothetical protein
MLRPPATFSQPFGLLLGVTEATYPPNCSPKQSSEIVDHFGAASYEAQKVEGQWRHGDVLTRDNLVKLVVDAPDVVSNRRWMKQYKKRWRSQLEQS